MKKPETKNEPKEVTINIKPPKFGSTTVTIVGVAPLVMNAFSMKTREQMRAKHEAGSTSQKGKKREPKDFQALYQSAMHVSREGWHGIPASAFRNAMISACRIVGFKMTIAKLSVFVHADGYDREDGTPLVKITRGEPKYVEHMTRNSNGEPDIRPRPMWAEGWEARVSLRWDEDQFTASDMLNLLARVGQQVGICEGRPDSKNSAGMGWGLFEVKRGAHE